MTGDTVVPATMGNSYKKSVDLETHPPSSPNQVIMAHGSSSDAIKQNNMAQSKNDERSNGNVSSNVVKPNPEIDIPFPKRMHLILQGPEIENRPCVVIGDVHGCLDELQELVAKVRSKEPDCLFLFCGDIINKGPKSLETIRYVRNMGSNAYTVRGNHEDHTLHCWLRWKKHQEKMPKKKFKWSKGLSMEEVEWLQELPYTISMPHINAIVVHAGFVPNRPLEEQNPWDMTEMRDMVGSTPSKLRVGTAWASLWRGPQHVYFGHDARRRLQQEAFATGLDTGCVFGGILTAQFLTGSKEMVRVQARYVYKKKDREPDQSTNGDLSDD